MRIQKTLTIVALAAACIAAASPADARRYHHRSGIALGIMIGAPLAYSYAHSRPYYRSYHRPYYGPYYGAPYYSYPPVVVAPAAPPVYIERQPAPQVQSPAAGYWHYCADSNSYYPYVQQCASQWQLVSPTPPQ